MHPAAWHPDPLGRHQYRYWDGERWTDHVADDGHTSTDPVDAASSSGTDRWADEGGQPTTEATGQVHPDPAGDAVTPAPGDAVTAAPGDGAATSGGAASPPATGTAGSAGAAPASGGWSGSPSGPSGPSTASGAPQAAGQVPADRTGSQSNGIAVAALVIGILSLLVSFLPLIGLIGVIGGIVALILGIVGRSNAKKGAGGGGMAIAGIVTGSIAMVIAILITVGLFAFGSSIVGESFRDFNECMREHDDEEFCREQLDRDLFDRMMN
jgi:hypothetical protein